MGGNGPGRLGTEAGFSLSMWGASEGSEQGRAVAGGSLSQGACWPAGAGQEGGEKWPVQCGPSPREAVYISFNSVKFKTQFSNRTSHLSNAQQPHKASDSILDTTGVDYFHCPEGSVRQCWPRGCHRRGLPSVVPGGVSGGWAAGGAGWGWEARRAFVVPGRQECKFSRNLLYRLHVEIILWLYCIQ